MEINVADAPALPEPLTPEHISLGKELLATMIRIRTLEEGIERHFLAGEIPGFAHLSIGQEAVAAGTCAALAREDYIASTHRGHGHTLAKGTPMRSMVAELFARETGVCRGKGGSMHIADFSVGMLGANGVVAGGFGLVTVWNLPVVFVLENNHYASTTSTAETMKIEDVAIRAAGYGMPSEIVDGFDALEVYRAVQTAVARARSGGGPTFVECKTYRIRGHYIGDPERYRSKDEVEARKSDDPIVRLQARLGDALSSAEFEAIWTAAREEFAEAVAFAKASPPAPASDAFVGLFVGDRDKSTVYGAFAERESEQF